MDEKHDEKGVRKHEEKFVEEKQSEEKFEEKYRSDPLGRYIGASIMIWAGIVFLANNLGYLGMFTPILDSMRWLPQGNDFSVFPFIHPDAMQIFLLGLGLILLVEIVMRLTIPEYRKPMFGTFVLLGVVLSAFLNNWSLIGPIILIGIGLSILSRGHWWGRRHL